jgi:hypothetical protein
MRNVGAQQTVRCQPSRRQYECEPRKSGIHLKWFETGSENVNAFVQLVIFCCVAVSEFQKQTKTNSLALSPRAYYTDCATATCRRNLVPTFCGCRVVRARESPTVVNFSFLDRSRDFSFK